MPIIARATQREFTQAPEGLYQAVCLDVVDLGFEQTPWGEKRKIQLRWQLDVLDEAATPPRPFIVTQKYTLSLDEKATLRHHLEAWRGRKFTAAELEGFDLENLLGVNCQLQLVHTLTAKGRTFAQVQAVVPLGKGMMKLRPSPDYVRVQDRTGEGKAPAPVAEEEVPF